MSHCGQIRPVLDKVQKLVATVTEILTCNGDSGGEWKSEYATELAYYITSIFLIEKCRHHMEFSVAFMRHNDVLNSLSSVSKAEMRQFSLEKLRTFREKYLAGDIIEDKKFVISCRRHRRCLESECIGSERILFLVCKSIMRNLCEAVLKASKEKEEVSIDAEFAKQQSVVRRVEHRMDEKDLSMLKEISTSSKVVDLVRRSITVPDIQRTDILQSIAISDGLDFGVQQVKKRLESSSETLAEMLETISLSQSSGSVVSSSIKIGIRDEAKIWLLGGLAIPRYPLTFVYEDSCNIFYHDHVIPYRLNPSQDHHVKVSMVCEDCPGRCEEIGVMQQAVIFIFLVPVEGELATEVSKYLPYSDYTTDTGAYRAFCLGRKISGILLRPQQQGTEPKSWNIDAKPFLGKSVRNIFETEPLRVLDEFTDSELSTLLVDKETIYGTHRDRAARLQSVKHPIARKYQRLLQLEEMQQENDIKLCDLHFCKPRYAIFEREGNPRSYRFVGEEKVCFYRGPILRRIQQSGVVVFRVPGIIEGRPSLKVGSLIRVRCATVPDDEYTMLCLGLESSDVFCLPPLGFRKSLLFHSLTQSIHGAVEMEGAPIKKQSVSIRFELDLPYQRMINSMDNLLSSNDSLLPNRDLVVKNLSLLPSISDVDALSESLELSDNLNHEQRYAVASFLLGAGRPSPYCLLGPPGTGKTLTATNCVLQILKRYPHARILCCAPKNFSADTMCWELGKRGISVTQMIRLNDPRRPCFTMRDDIMQYSVTNASGMFEIPSMCRLQEYQVIVCSCIAALYVPPGSRTHIVMDEAGEALLPESMMALASLKVGDENDNGWGVFLCGDPKQLGPSVRSRVASQGGLQKSLLEHLMSLYDSSNHLAASQNIAPRNYMLRINYRSSKELLDLPSRLFYSGQLEAASEYNQELRSQVQPPHFQWHEEGLSKHLEDKNLQNHRPSTVFYSVHGSQVRVGDSPSFFNPIEASTICHLVKQLLATQKDSKDTLGGEVRPSDIGVISTFRQQVYAIREILRSFGLGNIRVGTIDDYQGQEEKIILISTVLSDVSTLGEASSSLFSNPNRFNVATTRAKALLVCAGHPEVLLADTCWKEFVRSCIIKGNVFGAGSSGLLNSLSSDLHENLNGDGRAEGLLKSDFAKTLDQLADLAVLGRGSLPILYPNSIEDEYMADSGYGEDMPWRVLL